MCFRNGFYLVTYLITCMLDLSFQSLCSMTPDIGLCICKYLHIGFDGKNLCFFIFLLNIFQYDTYNVWLLVDSVSCCKYENKEIEGKNRTSACLLKYIWSGRKLKGQLFLLPRSTVSIISQYNPIPSSSSLQSLLFLLSFFFTLPKRYIWSFFVPLLPISVLCSCTSISIVLFLPSCGSVFFFFFK